MLDIEDTVVWINEDTKAVRVLHYSQSRRMMDWDDPIGAAYSTWKEASNAERVQSMLETAIELAMSGFQMRDILAEFAQAKEFQDYAWTSYPLARCLKMLEREHAAQA